MAKAAPRPWSLDEFLAWDDGTDQRYELVRGEVFAMAPPAEVHGTIVVNLSAALRPLVKAPCRAVAEAGIVRPDRDDTYYQADLAVTCAPMERGRQYPPDPVLIVEVLSPSTAVHDRGRKVATDWDNLTNGSLRAPISVDEMGHRVASWAPVSTNTDTSGVPQDLLAHCVRWDRGALVSRGQVG